MTELEARFILGLGGAFSHDDLRRAYRKAAADNHPDRGGNPARMVLVNEAYDFLKNPPSSVNVDYDDGDSPTPDECEPEIVPEQHSAPPTHPLNKYVQWTTAAFTAAAWLAAFLSGSVKKPDDPWIVVVLVIPLYYLFIFVLVRFLFRCGIHAYNLGIRMRDWIAIRKATYWPTASQAASDQRPMNWSIVIALGGAAFVAFLIGDGPGADNNDGLVLLGWTFVALAVAGRKVTAVRAGLNTISQGWSRMGALGRFVGGVAKVALAITLSILVVGAVGWGFIEKRERDRKAADASLAARKDWPAMTLEALGGVKLHLATMWRDGRIYYQFTVDGYPPQIATVRDNGGNASFTIQFEDSGGFTLREKTIELREMVLMIGSGPPAGLSWSGSEYADAEGYRSFASWDVVWRGFR